MAETETAPSASTEPRDLRGIRPGADPVYSVLDTIEVDLGKLSGTPVFRGTRVPVRFLFDYLKGGKSVTCFLDDYDVEPERVQRFLSALERSFSDPWDRADG